MNRYRLTFMAVLAASLGAGVWGLKRTPTPAFAGPQEATAGQLQLLDKKGQPAGFCPLKHTSVNADIAGYVSRVTVTQQFSNPSTTPVEAIYTFPLPSDAAVDDMTMTIGKRVIKGQIMKKEEARVVYEDAKARGQGAALLDQERPNIFTQSVANIMPGEQVNITISYVNLLKYQEGSYEFVFPMVVGPRFIGSGGGYTTAGQRGDPSPQTAVSSDPGTTPVVTDAHKITPPITPKGTRAGHDISINVNLHAGLPLTSVKSVLHQVNIARRSDSQAGIRLVDQATIPNKDFILKFSAAGSEVQSGVLTYSAGIRTASTQPTLLTHPGGYFTLIIQPPAAPPQEMISPKEMVFVIDQTGSQSGWPIAKAKETMRYCMKQMNPGDTFQLLAFNTEVFPCFDKPVQNSKENVDKARKFLAPIEGNGGTDILKAVDYALKIPDDPARLRIICYMTDGYVGNDMQIIDYVKKYRGRARMFPFGVGNSVNRFLIDGMAREGRGAAEYVNIEVNTGAVMGTSRELTGKAKANSQDVAERFYHRIASPVLLDPQVDWHGLPVEDVYPKAIPDVFSAGPVIVKGRYTHPGEGDITIKGILRGQPWSQTVHVNFPSVDKDGSAIATLWARVKIEDLQSQDWLGAQSGQPHPDIKDQIVNTALEYRLMSQYTSFVAVEQKVVNVGGQQRTLDVPVEMPEGVSYDGIFGESEAKFSSVLERSNTRGLGYGMAGAMGGGRASGGTNLYLYQPNAPAAAFSPPQQLGVQSLSAGKRLSESMPQLKAKVPATVSLGDEISRRAKSESLISDLRDGKDKAYKGVSTLKPEDRKNLLRTAKLSAEILKLLTTPRAKRPTSNIEVQIWLNNTAPEGMAKLKLLGFKLAATLIPNKLVLGMVDLDNLDALLELPWVRRVEIPKYK